MDHARDLIMMTLFTRVKVISAGERHVDLQCIVQRKSSTKTRLGILDNSNDAFSSAHPLSYTSKTHGAARPPSDIPIRSPSVQPMRLSSL